MRLLTGEAFPIDGCVSGLTDDARSGCFALLTPKTTRQHSDISTTYPAYD